MIALSELKSIVKDALEIIEKKQDVKEAEVFASASDYSIMRICYATNVPSNALEEPKSNSDHGLSVRILFNDGKIGFGKADCSFDKKSILKAYEKARHNSVLDKDFKSFPSNKGRITNASFADKKLFSLDQEKPVDLAYACLDSALSYLENKKPSENINITGELDFAATRIAVANTNSVLECDETTYCSASLTTILEAKSDVSGMWLDTSLYLDKLNSEEVGRASAEKAIALRGGSYLDSNRYDVVFGSMAFAELIQNVLTLDLGSVEYNATPYAQDLGKQIASPLVSITDNGALKDAVGSRKITDEGLATGKTSLIENGILKDFLSNDYYAKKFSSMKKFSSRNGFRSGGYASEPHISATNMVINKGNHSHEELLKEIKNGIYIGRIWYSYQVNGFTSADFTSTIRGDSYIIENGKIKSPLIPNTLRINDNFTRILKNITAIGKQTKQVVSWGEDSVVIAPEVAVNGVKLDRIANGIY